MAMKESIKIKNCESEIGEEAKYRDSLLPFEMIRTPILVARLIISMLMFALGGEIAYSQCAGLCIYEQDTYKTKIAPEQSELGNQEHAQEYFGPDGITGANETLSVGDFLAKSSSYSSGYSPAERIRLSQGLSDKFALNDMYSTEGVSENSAPNVYAANDAEAASGSQTTKSKDWEFILIPYGWFTSISEDIEVKGKSATANASFIDLLKHLDIGAMLHGEVWWKGRFGIFADTLFSKLTINKNATLRRFGSINANLTSTFFIQEFGGLYRIGTWPVGSPYSQFVQRSKPSLTFDVLAGGRYWHLNNELDINSPLGILPSQIDQSQNWFDFIVGVRTKLEFYKKLFLELRTDIGGFDLSFSSKFSWNVLAVVGYELPWYRITPLIGFRALYDDYANGSGDTRFEAKTWMYGPALGVAIRF